MASNERIALVTGASRGIGAACATALLADGWNVVFAARDRGGLEQAIAAAAGPAGEVAVRDRAVAMTVDVCDRASIDALFGGIAARFGRLDLLFNNAGLFPPSKPIDEVAPEDWEAAVRTNLSGMFFVMQQAFRMMKAQRPQGGRIINNGSLAAFAPRPASIAYTATKHGVLGLTRAASLDGRSCGIAVGQIDIGNAATAMTAHVEQGALQADGSMRPEVRMDLQHVASAVVTMARLPNEASIQSLTILPTTMPFIGRG
ncbi:MAG: SDR family oxidoreductase [bacterium]|jgi:NAD(P)-dependent dehydrogenase (short-subunit alcohol dehydrogenase family)|nr:SDR family oxidoreductase [Betaproteobacteria bacterium]